MRRIVEPTHRSGLAKKANKTDIKYGGRSERAGRLHQDGKHKRSENECFNDHQYPCDRDNRSNGQKVWNDSNDGDEACQPRTDRELMNGNTVSADGYPECWK